MSQMSNEVREKWTPGPWNFDPASGWIESVPGGVIITDVDITSGVDSDDQRDADAWLIAAAPDLYEALERLVNMTHDAAIARGEESMGVRMARIHATAALAKARGEEV